MKYKATYIIEAKSEHEAYGQLSNMDFVDLLDGIIIEECEN